jgi:hypothetical protein
LPKEFPVVRTRMGGRFLETCPCETVSTASSCFPRTGEVAVPVAICLDRQAEPAGHLQRGVAPARSVPGGLGAAVGRNRDRPGMAGGTASVRDAVQRLRGRRRSADAETDQDRWTVTSAVPGARDVEPVRALEFTVQPLWLRKGGPASDQPGVRPLTPNYDDAFGRIRCPLCRWQPTPSSTWYCDSGDTPEPPFPGCGAMWNTFSTRGRCPGCQHQWRWTSCLRCEGWSLHEDWYEADSS